MTPLPAAVLWDMDGTLVDTEPYWMDAESALIASFGANWSHEDALTLVGQGLWYSARVLQAHGVKLSEDEIVARLTAAVTERVVQGGIPWRPGARELLRALKQQSVPTALVTMSMRALAVTVASAIDFPAFDLIVAGDEVRNSKPHPEAYLAAASRLGVDIRDCVAIEDSAPGVASASAAGAPTIGVLLNSPLSEGNGYTIWPTLAGRTVADLSELLLRNPA